MKSPKKLESNDETVFLEVQSSSDKNIWYDVMYDIDHHWLCTCPDYYYRKKFCKHMKACAELLGVTDTTVFEEVRT